MSTKSDPRQLRGYLPTLDGWRAVSIVLVLCHHSGLELLHQRGVYGVFIFFAISGILICSRMLDEEEAKGKISLSNFYIRRAFRILPPALAYLLALAILRPWLHTPFLSWLSALFFFRNYIPWGADWYTSHFWSLAVEEHFYLLLPGILVFFPRARKWICQQ